MRFIIYGAGAIGGTIGARLHQAGEQVILIARGQHLDAIQKEGLVIKDPGNTTTLQMTAVGHPSEISFQPGDVVLLTMKTQHTQPALIDLYKAAGPGISVVCCQNGVANEQMALRHFQRVYAMVVSLPATHLNPGEVLHHALSPGGILDAGCYPVGTDPTITAVTAALTSAGFSANADDQAMRWKYAKLLQNLGNGLQASVSRDTSFRDIHATLIREATTCYEAAGITAASRDEVRERHNGMVQTAPIAGEERGGGSSWQSILRGTGDIETDYLNGEICLLGRLHGIPTPANEAVRQIANRMVNEKLQPGHFALSDVFSLITTLKQGTSA